MQRTLILLKPDCLEKQVAGQVISRFEEKDYSIIASKMIQLDQQLLLEHYAHVADLPFFPEIAEFMSSRPVLALVLEGERNQGNPGFAWSDRFDDRPSRHHPGDLGTDRMKSVAHASDSPESALVEINRFFEADQICG